MTQRIIKFRAWHTELKRMFSAEEMSVDQLTLLPNGQGFINVSGEHTSKSTLAGNKMIPLQFTGLLDKNGKEIYEGDILGYWGKEYPCTWVVGWNKTKACYSAIYTKEDVIGDKELQDLSGHPAFSLSVTAVKRKKIIGNIYENKDLLK